ncbi:MAG: exo-beta-N-acetylmuramidase NamZ domain-containing protein, partial [Gemmatimonadota bacterium]
ALFSPEHGIRGDVDRKVASSVDERTGLPIHSLYGETRKPTPEMLEGLDALVFDIQDIGTRYYSYVWTLALAMEAAAAEGLHFVVLDRPNPINGEAVQGNVRPSYMPVAFYETAMRHGFTAGELARYVNGEYGLGTDLHVVPMEGWERHMWWEDTGLPWRAPSPNMPSVESATHYPGTCLFEGTNMSVGRGTPVAFQQVGAPWLDAVEIVRALRERGFPGVTIEAVSFTPEGPTDGKFAGETVRGIRLTVTDRGVYDPVPVAVSALLEITRRHPDEFRWRDDWFDGLAGGPRLRERIQAGASLADITAPWAAEREAFEAKRRGYLLY